MRLSRSLIAGVTCVAFAVAASACSDDDDAKPRSTSTRARVSTTTTKPEPSGPIAPLSGVRGDAAVATRPALTVKVENTLAARPQYGLEAADIVYEEVVEGGVTRLAAVFHSRIPAVIGPVRSVRRTDTAIVTPLRGVFVYSGGARYAEDSIAGAPVVRFNETKGGDAMYRDRSRRAPHNLFVRGAEILARAADAQGPPPALFQYGRLPVSARVATAVEVGFRSGNAVTWKWDGATQRWQRFIFGRRDTSADGVALDADNVVIQFVEYRGGAGVIGAEAELTGTGRVIVLSRGKVVEGTWERATASDPGTLVDSAGAVIALRPGSTWVELPERRYSVTIS